MIRSIQVRDPKRTPCAWWPEVKALQGIDRLDFGPGVTILWGPNGIGKSTVLKALARYFHCFDDGIPKVTMGTVGAMHDENGPLDGLVVDHDGQPAHYFDPSVEPGLVNGYFGDNTLEGVQSVFRRKRSSGQAVNELNYRVFESADKLETVSGLGRSVNDHWRPKFDAVKAMLEGSGTTGRRTVLLDEPTRSLSMPLQRDAWRAFALQQRFQLIVATHDVFALNIKGGTYIDLEPGYLEQCRAGVADLGGSKP